MFWMLPDPDIQIAKLSVPFVEMANKNLGFVEKGDDIETDVADLSLEEMLQMDGENRFNATYSQKKTPEQDLEMDDKVWSK
jgi:hypothetical protein